MLWLTTNYFRAWDWRTCYRMFHQTVEEQATRFRISAIEPECKLIKIIRKLHRAYSPLMSSKPPTVVIQRCGPPHSAHELGEPHHQQCHQQDHSHAPIQSNAKTALHPPPDLPAQKEGAYKQGALENVKWQRKKQV